MYTLTPQDEKMKEVFKIALIEAIQENKEVFYDLFSEVLEDMALSEAIKAGEKSSVVSKQQVLDALRG
jgi:hypothetical protein